MVATASTPPALPEDIFRRTIDDFYRDGFAVVPGALGADECADLRRRADEAAAAKPSVIIRDPQDIDIAFTRLFVREPMLSLARAIVGPECRFCGENVVRNGPGQAISHWHVDDKLEYPLPPDVSRWDARVRLPLIWFTIQILLSDVDSLDDGPTEVVRGSHYSGRHSPKEDPVFEGRGAEPILGKAGDAYLFNHQLWHRGRPNTGTRVRYLLQLQYARGDSLAWRCQGAARTPALERMLEGADPRLVEIMLGPPKYV